MTDASRYTLFGILALISFIFYPVVLGRMMKQVKKGETTALEGFILAVDVYKRQVLAGVVEPASAVPVVVEDDVLVGANAVVIEGVHIGKGAVVAAGAVVVEDVPENAVVAGCPARIIKMKDAGTSEKTALVDALRQL